LPLPQWPGARYLLFVALPSGLISSWFARIQGDLLGAVGLWIAIPFVLVSAGLVAHLWRLVKPRSQRVRSVIGSAVVVIWSVAVSLSAQRPAYGVETRSSSPAGALGSLMARSLVRGATSVRRDAERAARAAPTAGADQIFFEPPIGSRSKYNVVWVIVDALRADRVGAVRNGRPITPHLDRLARDAVMFERAYAQGTSTSYSIPSMLTGKNVDAITWGWAHGRPQIPDSEHTIAERLRAHGYRTAIIPSKFIHGSLTSILQGYGKKVIAAGSASTRRLWAPRTSPIATAKALTQIGEFAPGPLPQRPFFLTVYYGEPHAPYVNHVDHVPPFPDTPEGRYDADVAFVDLHLGQLIEHLRLRAPLWERTILIVTSDHGEAFGEHGRDRHGRDCHIEAVHVPLLVRVPGVPAARVAPPVALVDIVPMLIELTGAERQSGTLSGRSLLIPMRAPDRVDPTRAIFCAAAHQRSDQRPFLVRAVRQSGHVLMHSGAAAVALFDATVDPGEREDVLDQAASAERARQLAQLLTSSSSGNVGEPPPSASEPAADQALDE
jgi:arylsulfatase A-like enzyme